MEEEVSKKTSVILLLVAIILAILITFGILNYIQVPKVVEGVKESASSGGVTLTVKKPPIVKDESGGGVSLEILPPGGEK